MKALKAIIVILAIAMIPLAFCMSREGPVGLKAPACGNTELIDAGPSLLDRMMEIQAEIGCVKIDGVIGPETTEKFNKAVCDEYAAKYFKETQDE